MECISFLAMHQTKSINIQRKPQIMNNPYSYFEVKVQAIPVFLYLDLHLITIEMIHWSYLPSHLSNKILICIYCPKQKKPLAPMSQLSMNFKLSASGNKIRHPFKNHCKASSTNPFGLTDLIKTVHVRKITFTQRINRKKFKHIELCIQTVRFLGFQRCLKLIDLHAKTTRKGHLNTNHQELSFRLKFSCVWMETVNTVIYLSF